MTTTTTTKTSKTTTKTVTRKPSAKTTTRKPSAKTTAKAKPETKTTAKAKPEAKIETGFKPSVLNFDEATKVEFNKELKRIASNKCNAKSRATRAEAEGDATAAQIGWTEYRQNIEDYDRVKAAKDVRFSGRKTYMDYTEDDIAGLNLKQTLAGIASLACRRNRYPHLYEETMAQERKFASHRDELNGKASAKEALKQMSPEEIEAFLAELK